MATGKPPVTAYWSYNLFMCMPLHTVGKACVQPCRMRNKGLPPLLHRAAAIFRRTHRSGRLPGAGSYGSISVWCRRFLKGDGRFLQKVAGNEVMVFMQQGLHRLPLRQGLPLRVRCFLLLIFFLICAGWNGQIVWPTHAQRMADGMAQLVAPRHIPHGAGAEHRRGGFVEGDHRPTRTVSRASRGAPGNR